MSASQVVVLLCLLAVFALLALILKTRAENAREHRDFDERINRQGANMLTLTSLRETLEALSRNARLEGLHGKGGMQWTSSER